MSDVYATNCVENGTLCVQNEELCVARSKTELVAPSLCVTVIECDTISQASGDSLALGLGVDATFDPDGVNSHAHGEHVQHPNQTECDVNPPNIGNGEGKSVENTEFIPPDDDLRERITKQVEFYFSDANILKDAFLLKHVRRNKQGFVSLKLITSFRKVKSLTKDYRVVAESVNGSVKLEVNEEGTKVRRTDPLPDYDETTPSRTVVAVNLPFCNPSVENVAELFSKSGDIALVRILRPGKALPQDVKKHLAKHPELGTTMCAVVEFEQHQSAKKACETMTNDEDWRRGLHVVLLAPSKKEKSAAAAAAAGETQSEPRVASLEVENASSARRGSGDSQTVIYHGDDIRADDEAAAMIAADGKNRRRRGARRKQAPRLEELTDIVGDVNGSSASGSDVESERPSNGVRREGQAMVRNSLSPWREPAHLTPSSTPGSSPTSSPRSSPRGSPNLRRRGHAKSPLVASSPHASPRASPDLWRRRDGDPSSGSSSPWIQRRMRGQATATSPGSSPALARRTIGCVRQPHGPDGTRGFTSIGRGKQITE